MISGTAIIFDVRNPEAAYTTKQEMVELIIDLNTDQTYPRRHKMSAIKWVLKFGEFFMVVMVY